MSLPAMDKMIALCGHKLDNLMEFRMGIEYAWGSKHGGEGYYPF
jgi:hypothetical protein